MRSTSTVRERGHDNCRSSRRLKQAKANASGMAETDLSLPNAFTCETSMCFPPISPSMPRHASTYQYISIACLHLLTPIWPDNAPPRHVPPHVSSARPDSCFFCLRLLRSCSKPVPHSKRTISLFIFPICHPPWHVSCFETGRHWGPSIYVQHHKCDHHIWPFLNKYRLSDKWDLCRVGRLCDQL